MNDNNPRQDVFDTEEFLTFFRKWNALNEASVEQKRLFKNAETYMRCRLVEEICKTLLFSNAEASLEILRFCYTSSKVVTNEEFEQIKAGVFRILQLEIQSDVVGSQVDADC